MAAVDKFGAEDVGLDSPLTDGEAVTPSDTEDLDYASRSLWIGGAGNVKVTMLGGTELTFVGCTAGQLLPYRVTRVHSGGTTATNIIALY